MDYYNSDILMFTHHFKCYLTKHSTEDIMYDIVKLKCLKCGHGWIPRVPDPRVCPNPKCHSIRWDVAPVKNIEIEVRI